MTMQSPTDSLLQGVGRVCMTLPSQGHAYDEMVSVLTAVVQELGGDVFLARDGDRTIMEADVTILFGRCAAFGDSAYAEEAARKLVRCGVGKLPKPLRSLIRCVPSHSSLVNLLRRIRCAQLARRCGWDRRFPDDRVHAREWHHAVENALWLKQWYSDTWCDCLAVSTMPRRRLLTEMGIPCEYAPLGYHPLWGTDRGEDRDLDVVFLGHVKRTGRERLVSRIARRSRLLWRGTDEAAQSREDIPRSGQEYVGDAHDEASGQHGVRGPDRLELFGGPLSFPGRASGPC